MNNDKTIEKRAGFTQGEWTIRECPQGWHYEGGEDPFTISADGRFIASIKLQSRNTQANARLIASAPAMYEALQNLLTEFDAYEGAMCKRFGAGHEDYGRQRELARLALAKADGREA